MTKKYIRTALKIFLSAMVLLLFLVVAGILYIRYADNQQNTEQSVPLPEPPSPPVIEPPKLSPKAKESVVVQTITSPVKRGSEASITVKTNPKSECKIKVSYKDKNDKDVEYKNSALIDKKVDEFGVVSWDWPVYNSAPVGKWAVTVTCFYYKQSGVVIGDMLVK